MGLMDRVKKTGMSIMYDYLDKDPDRNLPKIMDWVDQFAGKDVFAAARKQARKVIEDPDNNWYRLIKSLWTDIDDGVRKTLFENFIVNSALIGFPKECDNREKYGCNIPWAILMDPTSACNLHCTGCWAAEYGNKMNMDLDTMDSIIRQGTELGTYMYLYTGGEPLVRKKDIITLCERHPDCVFMSFTNATLIDEAFADEMLRVKNFVPAISVEGFEEATDSRRGHGTFQAVMRAMEILKRKKLPFGVSCCYTRANVDVIGSEAYFDKMVEWGAKFAWFFTYMPIGADAVPELMVTAEQREFMYHQIRKFRDSKPIFTLDFWKGVLPADGTTATSMRRGTLNPVRLSIIQTPISTIKPFWRPINLRSLWPIMTISLSIKIICVLARCWITMDGWRTWWIRAQQSLRISLHRRMYIPSAENVRMQLNTGQSPLERCGRLHIRMASIRRNRFLLFQSGARRSALRRFRPEGDYLSVTGLVK